MRSILLFCALLFTAQAFSQCTTLGQTPPTAFPVCGDQTFHQTNVPICTSTDLYVPGCNADGALYADKNPFWYKFTCYQTGSLGFLITPNDPGDDYDWQLYDVTGLYPNQVLTNHNIVVTGNWSGTYAPTGTSASGVSYIQCASNPTDNLPTFAQMPTIFVGHNYILLISHFTDSQSGYSLSFGGGTGVITDPLDPHLVSANAPCDGTEIRVITNKQMRCNTLAADGSDFKVLTPGGVTLNPISASSSQCSNGFDLDTLSVFMSAPLAPGTYKIFSKKGTDGNTILDDCDRGIPEDEMEQFTVYPLFPTLMDSLTPPKCAPQTISLVFKKRIKCSSISAGDFNITGPYPPPTVVAATGNCDNNGLTQTITLQLSAPFLVDGNFTLHLVSGPDGNTIFDECDMQTPPSDINFHVSDTVSAGFTYSIAYSCTQDVVSYFHNGANHVNSWLWNTNGGSPSISHAQNTISVYTNFLPKITTLIVSNGVCSDTTTDTTVFNNYIKADFEVTPLVCPAKPASFTNTTIGTITNWEWIMGNGNIITVRDPAPQFYPPLNSSDYNAMPELIAKNNYGCSDTVSMPVKVVYSCFIAVPSAFTPNGDGLNDYLYPLKAYKSSNLSFSVYNRFGQLLFHSTNWLDKWDGTFRGQAQDPGTYVWVLQYLDGETGRMVSQKGTSILIR